MFVHLTFGLIACSVAGLLLVHPATAQNAPLPSLPTSPQLEGTDQTRDAAGPLPTAQSTPATTTIIKRASKRHEFQIEMTEDCAAQFRKSDYCEGPAVVRVFSRATQKEIQTLELASLITVRGATEAQRVELSEPRDYDPSLLLEDFNFDGEADLALQTGNNGPYGSPSYQAYLFQKRTGKFVLATELSELTEGYLGLFDVDYPRKRITTYSKGGCCYHESREYEFVGTRPVLVARFAHDATANDGYVLENSEQLVRGRWVKQVTRSLVSEVGEDW